MAQKKKTNELIRIFIKDEYVYIEQKKTMETKEIIILIGILKQILDYLTR